MMTSISFYLDNLGNRRGFLSTHSIKSRVGNMKTRVGKLKKFFGASRRIFSKNLCPPWPETVPAPLSTKCGWDSVNSVLYEKTVKLYIISWFEQCAPYSSENNGPVIS